MVWRSDLGFQLLNIRFNLILMASKVSSLKALKPQTQLCQNGWKSFHHNFINHLLVLFFDDWCSCITSCKAVNVYFSVTHATTASHDCAHVHLCTVTERERTRWVAAIKTRLFFSFLRCGDADEAGGTEEERFSCYWICRSTLLHLRAHTLAEKGLYIQSVFSSDSRSRTIANDHS